VLISRSDQGTPFLTAGRVYGALAAFVLVIVGARIIGVFTLYIQADEFVLLQRAVTTERTGVLVGGGRPGLGTLVLTPFAAACHNAVDAVVQARLLWTGLTAGAALAFWFLLRGIVVETRWRRAAIVTGLGLWMLSPQVLYYSTQVRTDQPAIMFGLWGGVALLASRHRMGWAPLAGVLLGVGFLFSQKLLYVAGLVAVLGMGDVFMRGPRIRRDLGRALLAVGAFLLLVLGYRQALAQIAGAPTLLPVATELSNFEYYRMSLGWDRYRSMLPMLIPQILVLVGLLGLTAAWAWDRSRHGKELAVAWSVVTVGAAVVLVHAGRFPYFYMVLGLFPAVVGGLIVSPLLERVGTPLRRGVLMALIWLPLVLYSVAAAAVLAGDTQQQQQRASLDWVERNFSPEAVGYTNWGAFACRDEPWPVRFGAGLAAAFRGDARERSTQELMAAFRDRPVAFMIPPIEPHPPELEEFWRTRYVHYYGGIHVPGRHVRGGAGWTGTFEAVVPGNYVWLAMEGTVGPLTVEGGRVESGSTITLEEQRVYSISLAEGGDGMFVLALAEPPAGESVPFFDYPGVD
jgi:hypothetical protein